VTNEEVGVHQLLIPEIYSVMEQLWLVTLPVGQEAPKSLAQAITVGTASEGKCCDVFPFEIPSLHHGTLDSLIALSDELHKVSVSVEGVIKKVERQYFEVHSGLGGKVPPLKVQEKPVELYLKKWSWDYARYQHQGKKLSDLVQQITTMTAQVDDELKILLVSQAEKQQTLATWQRRKQTNLGTSDFEDFITHEILSGLEIVDNDHLLTLMVSMSKSMEDDFLANYALPGGDPAAGWGRSVASYGEPGNRNSEKGSPVVPGSARLVIEVGDQVMYAFTMLRGHSTPGHLDMDGIFHTGNSVDYVEPIKSAFRERRCIVRAFHMDPIKESSVDIQLAAAKKDVEHAQHTIIRWSSAHFGDVFAAFVHLKVISGFVESVLRYGVPVDFAAMFIVPDMRRTKQLRSSLASTILKIRPHLLDGGDDIDEGDDEGNADNLPFVCHKFAVLGIPPSST
jgi:V-type H+-transporting ATPase subunit C